MKRIFSFVNSILFYSVLRFVSGNLLLCATDLQLESFEIALQLHPPPFQTIKYLFFKSLSFKEAQYCTRPLHSTT